VSYDVDALEILTAAVSNLPRIDADEHLISDYISLVDLLEVALDQGAAN
jgi:hypothetical protein